MPSDQSPPPISISVLPPPSTAMTLQRLIEARPVGARLASYLSVVDGINFSNSHRSFQRVQVTSGQALKAMQEKFEKLAKSSVIRNPTYCCDCDNCCNQCTNCGGFLALTFGGSAAGGLVSIWGFPAIPGYQFIIWGSTGLAVGAATGIVLWLVARKSAQNLEDRIVKLEQKIKTLEKAGIVADSKKSAFWRPPLLAPKPRRPAIVLALHR